jgi:hypothetical protein
MARNGKISWPKETCWTQLRTRKRFLRILASEMEKLQVSRKSRYASKLPKTSLNVCQYASITSTSSIMHTLLKWYLSRHHETNFAPLIS